MVTYLVNQIVLGKLTYQQVITKKPNLKDDIDAYIADKGLTVDTSK